MSVEREKKVSQIVSIVIESTTLSSRNVVINAKNSGVAGWLSRSLDGSFEALASGSREQIANFVMLLIDQGARVELETMKVPTLDSTDFQFKGDSFHLRPISVRDLENAQLRKLLKQEEPIVDNFCEQVIDNYQVVGQASAARLTKLAKQIYRSTLSKKVELFECLVGHLDSSHIDSWLVSYSKSKSAGHSFRSCLVGQGALDLAYAANGKKSPIALVCSKVKAQQFMSKLGHRTPVICESGLQAAQIRLSDRIAVKPTHGASSKGVFLVKDANTILDVFKRELIGEEQFYSRTDEYAQTGAVTSDSWIIEQLIPGTHSICPFDIKFYCFYGQVVSVLEVQRYPRKGFNWYDTHGDPIRTGKYEDMEFDGLGFFPHELEMAAKASLEIPIPFIRIDFIRACTDELVFVELTPRPGNFHKFNYEMDSKMGREFWAAHARLSDDLLNGKRFANFRLHDWSY